MYRQTLVTTMIIAAILLTTSQLARAQQQPQLQTLKSIIEKRWTYTMDIPGMEKQPISNVSVIYESPKTVILDASEFDTNPLWQAMDIAKERGYTLDQIYNYISSTSSAGAIHHWTIFMSHA